MGKVAQLLLKNVLIVLFVVVAVVFKVCIFLILIIHIGAVNFAFGKTDIKSNIRGSVTNLPLPRFVSLKTKKGNVRRGPGFNHRIDWVFQHQHMPLQVVAEYGHWRQVRDIDGQGGWIFFRLLSGTRTVLFTADQVPLHRRANSFSRVIAIAESGVIAQLGQCGLNWCKIDKDSIRGWVKKSKIWGVATDETRWCWFCF